MLSCAQWSSAIYEDYNKATQNVLLNWLYKAPKYFKLFLSIYACVYVNKKTGTIILYRWVCQIDLQSLFQLIAMTTMTGCYYFHITLLSQNEIYSGPSDESLSELGFESRLESNNLSQNHASACVHACMYISQNV